MIKVLVVEDSPVVQEFLLSILRSDPEIDIVGVAQSGEEALEAVGRIKPDVVTMDIHMPKMNGFEATRKIMETCPTPIVIVSGTTDIHNTAKTFWAMEAGALAVLPRPAGVTHPDHRQNADDLVKTVKLMSEVKVVRRWSNSGKPPFVPPLPVKTAKTVEQRCVQVIAIGASTGGPAVLKTILTGLPKTLPVPVLIVQHMAKGFIGSFVEWMSQACEVPVSLAADGMLLVPGHIYMAPDDFHMTVTSRGTIALVHADADAIICPSISHLFRSVAEVYGKNAIGVLLTGMGKDGADALKLMEQSGALTMVQDAKSSVVYGMAREAVRLGAVTYEFSPEQIVLVLNTLLARQGSTGE